MWGLDQGSGEAAGQSRIAGVGWETALLLKGWSLWTLPMLLLLFILPLLYLRRRSSSMRRSVDGQHELGCRCRRALRACVWLWGGLAVSLTGKTLDSLQQQEEGSKPLSNKSGYYYAHNTVSCMCAA